MHEEELKYERAMLKYEGGKLLMYFMKEIDKRKASEILADMRRLAKRIEAINCELAGIELRKKLRKDLSN